MIGRLFKTLKKDAFGSHLWNELSEMPGLLIAVTDASFVLAWANDYFYAYFKCRPEDVIGKPMHSFLGEDIRGDMSENHIARVLEEGCVLDHFARTSGADGEFVIIRWNQRAFMAGDNRHRTARKHWILSVGFPPGIGLSGIEEPLSTIPTYNTLEQMEVISLKQVQDIDIYAREDQEVDFDLIRWISRENFIMHYQPRVNARTKVIIGAEGLVRVRHPEHGLLYPASFLPIAEKTGHILDIGDYVVDSACKKMREWQDTASEMILSVSINISPKQLCDEGFVQTLLSAISRYRIEPSQLMLELSEQTVAVNFQEAKQIIQVLKGIGFKVTIDDYSTGFLPLSALTQLAVDNITIDQAYLSQGDNDPKVYRVIESIILLARGLNMTVTAGGVKNRKQLDFLMDNAVDFLQGYLISEPLPEAEFDRFLKTNPDFYTRHI